MGWPSPACRAHVGQPIGRRGKKLDKYGFNLQSAQLPGDGFRRGHDDFKYALHDACEMAGIESRVEVANQFAAAMSNEARATREADLSEFQRSHIIPDLWMRLVRLGPHSLGGTVLGEIKLSPTAD